MILGDVRRVQLVGLDIGGRQATQVDAVAHVAWPILVGHCSAAAHPTEGIVDVELAAARIDARDGRPAPAVPGCRRPVGQRLCQGIVHGLQDRARRVQCATGYRRWRQRIDHCALWRADMDRLVGALVVRHLRADAQQQPHVHRCARIGKGAIDESRRLGIGAVKVDPHFLALNLYRALDLYVPPVKAVIVENRLTLVDPVRDLADLGPHHLARIVLDGVQDLFQRLCAKLLRHLQ